MFDFIFGRYLYILLHSVFLFSFSSSVIVAVKVDKLHWQYFLVSINFICSSIFAKFTFVKFDPPIEKFVVRQTPNFKSFLKKKIKPKQVMNDCTYLVFIFSYLLVVNVICVAYTILPVMWEWGMTSLPKIMLRTFSRNMFENIPSFIRSFLEISWYLYR